MLTQWASLIVLTALMSAVVALCLLDARRRRPAPAAFSLSFLVPCYNDAPTVARTLESIFSLEYSGRFEVLVVDDCSTDGSRAAIEAVAAQHPIRVKRNVRNMGKSASLNALALEASHDILVFLDADTEIHAAALNDMLSRMTADPRLAAVSCPYQPSNKGFLARMQAIEYSMLAMIQAAYNRMSALAIWGGCLAVRRASFGQAGGFSLSAITEDVDLAFKLNRLGQRVEQTLVPVPSLAPCTARAWYRQKVRWTSGGFQCLLRHPGVWIRNPLHVALACVYAFLSLASAYGLVTQLLAANHLVETLTAFDGAMPWRESVMAAARVHEGGIWQGVLLAGAFCLCSVIYVIPLITRLEDTLKVLLAIPFSLGYFPLYALVSVVGMAYFVFVLSLRSRNGARAW